MGMLRFLTNWALPIAAIIVATVYALYFGRGFEFWDQILATILSLIAGIPFALWIDRLIKIREGREQVLTDRKKEEEILDFILEELELNEGLLRHGRNIGAVSFHPLETAMWEVLKASGDLSYIEDITILHEITSAYEDILKIKHFEEEALDDWNEYNRTLERDSTWKIQTMRAREFDSSMLLAISEARDSIMKRKAELTVLLKVVVG